MRGQKNVEHNVLSTYIYSASDQIKVVRSEKLENGENSETFTSRHCQRSIISNIEVKPILSAHFRTRRAGEYDQWKYAPRPGPR